MDLVKINKERVPVTTSRVVADHFGKRHDNVLRDIEVIINTLKAQEISDLSFEESEYTNDRGKTYPMFEMDRKGFMLLVMGFTGDTAMKFKSDFVDAFDAMEESLK